MKGRTNGPKCPLARRAGELNRKNACELLWMLNEALSGSMMENRCPFLHCHCHVMRYAHEVTK